MIIKMIKSLAKSVYLLPIRMLASKQLPKNNHIVFLLSFPSTSDYILSKLADKYKERLVICYTNEAKPLAESYQKKDITIYALDSIGELYTKVIPVIKSAQVILCDNYFAILAGFDFKDGEKVVQLWHANGAIKRFGMEAEYAKDGTSFDRKRYKNVYDRYTHLVVSSEEMANIFCESYLNDYKILPFGYPPTDVYFEYNIYPGSFLFEQHKHKKIALYAPTYRDQAEQSGVDLREMNKHFPEGWQLYVRVHPHDHKLKKQLVGLPSIKQISEEVPLSTVFNQIDCLITDYSSIPFEYSLAKKDGKIIYYCYDLEQYEMTVGLQRNFKEWAAPYLVSDIEELIAAIKEENDYPFDQFNAFWNTFANGHAADQLIEWIDEQYEN